MALDCWVLLPQSHSHPLDLASGCLPSSPQFYNPVIKQLVATNFQFDWTRGIPWVLIWSITVLGLLTQHVTKDSQLLRQLPPL